MFITVMPHLAVFVPLSLTFSAQNILSIKNPLIKKIRSYTYTFNKIGNRVVKPVVVAFVHFFFFFDWSNSSVFRLKMILQIKIWTENA